MGRTIDQVIDEILAFVPSDEFVLRERLENLNSESGFRAPEAMWMSWVKLAEVLTECIGKPTQNWHFQIIQVVQGK